MWYTAFNLECVDTEHYFKNYKKIQCIIKDYHKQLYANQMDNLEEMNEFLEKYNLPKLNQKILTDPAQVRKMKL